MILFPAIDIMDGKCVRLKQGRFHERIVYSDKPIEVALEWEENKASYLHIVDLDGAQVGHSINDDVIEKIASALDIPIQVGGGIRTIKDIEHKLSLGVERIILGTVAANNPGFVKEAISIFGPDKIVVGIDAKDGMVATEGWEKMSNYNALNLALQMRKIGVKTIVYTDISKDGMLQGPNVGNTKELIDKTGLDVIASGISSMKDLELVSEINAYGCIIGKALYEKHIDLKTAIEMFE